MSESMHSLKHRLRLIQDWRPKPPHWFVSIGGVLLLTSVILAQPIAEAPSSKPLASTVLAIQGWLGEIDRGDYQQSWKDAGATFQHAVSSDRWVAQLAQVRTPLGTCTSRKLLSAVRKDDTMKPNGKMLGHELIVARFNTSFTNMLGAVETVAFEKGTDGVWRASGYFIRPAGA